MAAQSSPPPVLKQRLLLIDRATVSDEELADELSRLRQQRAKPFPPSFTVYAHEGWRFKVEITRLGVKELLNTGASVVQNAEEDVVAFTVPGVAINLRKQMAKFLLAEITQYRAERLLHGNRQNRTAQSSQ